MLSESFWEDYFSTYDVLNRAIPYQRHIKALVKATSVQPGQQVLDLGSGTGNLSVALGKCGADVVGLDYSSAGLRLHQKKAPLARIIKHDLTRTLPFNDGEFSKVVCNSVLYTIDPTLHRLIVAEVYRVLKPGGLFVLSNVKEGFRPLTVLERHLQDAFYDRGLLSACTEFVYLLGPVIRMLRYNQKITEEGQNGNYRFFAEGEQKELLTASGFVCPFPTQSSYADQSFIDIAQKPEP